MARRADWHREERSGGRYRVFRKNTRALFGNKSRRFSRNRGKRLFTGKGSIAFFCARHAALLGDVPDRTVRLHELDTDVSFFRSARQSNPADTKAGLLIFILHADNFAGLGETIHTVQTGTKTGDVYGLRAKIEGLILTI